MIPAIHQDRRAKSKLQGDAVLVPAAGASKPGPAGQKQ